MSGPPSEISYAHLPATYMPFVKAHEGLVSSGGIVNPEIRNEAQTSAEQLAKLLCLMRSQILQANNQNGSDHYLRNECLLPLALELSTLIAHPKIQALDKLKEEMSEATRALAEIGVRQCEAQSRRVYEPTRDEINSHLAEVIKSLPKGEVLTEFNLKCARAGNIS